MLQCYEGAERPQHAREPVTDYILDKARWLRQCPDAFGEARFIPYIVRGLNSSELRAALSLNAPISVAGLLETVAAMEEYQPIPTATGRQSNAVPAASATAPVPVARRPPIPTLDRGDPVRPGDWPPAPAPKQPNERPPAPQAPQQQAAAPVGPGPERALIPVQQQPYRVPRTLQDVQWRFRPFADVLSGETTGKRARRSGGASPAVNFIEDPNRSRPRVQVNITGLVFQVWSPHLSTWGRVDR